MPLSEGDRPPARHSMYLDAPPSTVMTTSVDFAAGFCKDSASTTLNGAPQRSPTTASSAFMLSAEAVPTCRGAADVIASVSDGRSSAAAAVASTAIQSLRGRLNEGTVHRIPLPLPASAAGKTTSASVATNDLGAMTKSLMTRYGGRVHQLRVGTPNSTCATEPGTRDSRTAEVAQMVQAATLQKTWAANFTNTAVLRETVTTDEDAHGAFEEELVRELNEVRRAPAAYASVVEREATVGAPYVEDTDLYFADEASAEIVAAELRRRLEEPPSIPQGETGTAAPVNGSGAVQRGTARVITPPTASSTTGPGTEKRKGKKNVSSSPAILSASSSSAGNGGGGNTATRHRGSRPPSLSEKHGATPGHVRRGTSSQEVVPGGPAAPACSATARTTAPTLRDHGLRELTLEQLRYQFRCQQRYRAALEVMLREMQSIARQAQMALQAAWSVEDEKVLKKGRRSMGTNLQSSNFNTTSAMLSANATNAVPGLPGNPNKRASRYGSAHIANRLSATSEDAMMLRRNEEVAQLRTAHEVRIQHMERELRYARDACRRSLAGANLLLDAVRALREAQPVPPVQRHRGLSLAARDTGELYYGDEERVAALHELYGLSRSTLVGLTEQGTTMSATPSTLRHLSYYLQQRDGEPETNREGSQDGQSHFGDEEGSEGRSFLHRSELAPPWLIPLLSEEVSLLANMAQDACTTYGYVSGEVRGLHAQVIAGSPRSLILQTIVGSLTPVLKLTSRSVRGSSGRPVRTSSPSALGSSAGMQRYAGLRVEGRVYVASEATETEEDAEEAAFVATTPSIKLSQLEGGPNDGVPADGAADVWSSAGDAPFCAARTKLGGEGSGGGGVLTVTSNAQRAAAAAAQRLWPLLWAGAYTVGCSWQQVRGGRHVPSYAEACAEQHTRLTAPQEVAAATSTPSPNGTGSSTAIAAKATAAVTAISTTLLFASGFEEYEVVRGCQHMSPSAAQRIVQNTILSDSVKGGSPRCGTQGSLEVATVARRAAVDVHSSLGVTLLTPTVHPLCVPAGDPACRVVCVAVRVPGPSPDLSTSTAAPATHGTDDSTARTSSVRIAAEVSCQSELTPAYPTTCAAEILTQQSPVDPSVWLVLVDTAAAFRRHTQVAAAASANRNGGLHAAAAAVPLALHIFAKDMSDPTGEYEHVAFIRLQQDLQPREGRPSARMATATTTVNTPSAMLPPFASTVLMAPEWRYLLEGLSTAASATSSSGASSSKSAAAAPPMTGLITQAMAPPLIAGTALAAPGATVAAAAATAAVGWPTLHEPLLGRGGVLLYPLSMNIRLGDLCSDGALGGSSESADSSVRYAGGYTKVSDAASAEVSAGRIVRVAVQLPRHCNEQWWRRRLSSLRHLQTKLTEEIEAEGDELGKVRDANTSGAGGVQAARELPGEPSILAADPTAAAGNHVDTQSPASSHLSAPSTATQPAVKVPEIIPAVGGAGATVAGDVTIHKKGSAADTPIALTRSPSFPRGDTHNEETGKAATANGTASHSPKNKKSSPVLKGIDGCSAVGASGGTSHSQRRTLSFHTAPQLPESAALAEYNALLQRARATSPLLQHDDGTSTCFEAPFITVKDLRSLASHLHKDAELWAAHLMWLRPVLERERDRIAVELSKKKGKEQQRLQRDHDEVVGDSEKVEKGVVTLQQAALAATNALRLRERTQVLRRARLARVKEELASIMARPLAPAITNPAGSAVTIAVTAEEVTPSPPHVTLRIFTSSAAAAGSGRSAATLALAHMSSPPSSSARRAEAMVNCRVRDTALLLMEGVLDEVELKPCASSSSRAPTNAKGRHPTDIYVASCTVPLSLTGWAALYIDGEVAVTWSV